MASPEHIDDQNLEDQQVPSLAEEQQAPGVVVKKRPWLKPLMRGAGIVLSLACSFAGVWATFVFQQSDIVNWALLEVILLGAVSAVLFWSWWAILVIPIAFSLGEFLAFYLISLVISPNPLDIGDTGFGVFLWAIIGPIIATVGALIGTVIVKVVEAEIHYRQGTGSGSATMSNNF